MRRFDNIPVHKPDAKVRETDYRNDGIENDERDQIDERRQRLKHVQNRDDHALHRVAARHRDAYWHAKQDAEGGADKDDRQCLHGIVVMVDQREEADAGHDEQHQPDRLRGEIHDRHEDREHDPPRRRLRGGECELEDPAQGLSQRVQHHAERILDGEKVLFHPLGHVARLNDAAAGIMQGVKGGEREVPDRGAFADTATLQEVGHRNDAVLGFAGVAPVAQTEAVEQEIVCRHNAPER